MATRICVKNIPRYITDEKLRDHFAGKGEVTDAKIIRTRDGRTRQFGFVGYRSAEEAEEAVKYFHRSFFDTSRLTCEIAYQIGSQDLPRPWSRHSEGSSAFKKSNTTDNEDLSASGHKDGMQAKVNESKQKNAVADPELEEFLQLMQPRLKTKVWANDTIGPAQEGGPSPRNRNGKGTKIRPNNVEVKVVDGFERRVPINKGRTSESLTQSHVRFEDGSDSEDDGAEELEAGVSLDDQISESADIKSAIEENSEVVNNQAISDTEYLKSRVTENWSDSEDDDEQDVDKNEEHAGERVLLDSGDESREGSDEEEGPIGSVAPGQPENLDGMWKPAKAILETGPEQFFGIIDGEKQENVAETGRLFVRNLPYTASEEELTELFSKFGQLSQVHLVLDKETKRSKGFAYILYMLPEDAVRAFETLDKSIFQGRLLHILASHRPPPAPLPKLDQLGAGTTKYKTEREAQRKAAEASGDTRAWNTLFLRQDTVAENVAKKYGMTKSEFMDPEAGDLAVRMALGETHIIAETKRALSDNGVDIEVLEKLTTRAAKELQRSGRVIVVKNLPFSTTEDDLIRIFAAHGTLGRIILPPTKTLALVEYLEAAEARRAFKSLAYKRYQHVPLYLEWAPVGLLADPGPGGSENASKTGKRAADAVVGESLVKRADVEDTLIGLPDDYSDSNAAQARSVFVKNLSFSTTREKLMTYFEQLMTSGSLKSVAIKMKPSKNGKSLSMGYGFLEFDSVETAMAVSKQYQGTVLDNHALVLQLSRSSTKGNQNDSMEFKGPKQEKTRNSTKLIVRNVAFEATRKDLHQLFSPFGQMKSLRLPKRFDGKHRGFAFVEFVTRQEAANAFSGLKNTHLYGRHLVLEQAKDAESLDELRSRTAQQFFAENGVDTSHDTSNKRRKTLASVTGSRSEFNSEE